MTTPGPAASRFPNTPRGVILPTLRTFVIGAVALGVVLFVPAWTLSYWQAWVFIVNFMISVNILGLYMVFRDPALLERRLQAGPGAEQTTAQKVIVMFLLLGSVALLVFCGLDHRFAWSHVPAWASIAGDLLVFGGLMITLRVLQENSYGASNITVVEGQPVISTGPYGVVRHPMYAGILVMIIGVPPALGSWWGLVVMALLMPVLIFRILEEEKTLRTDLTGYADYMRKVRYRLVPWVW